MTTDDYADGYTILVKIEGDEPVHPGPDYAAWVNGLRSVIGAVAVSFGDEPWTVGDHRRWTTDWTGRSYRIDKPYANVWQQISGDIASLAMVYVWAAIHLVQPLEAAGYRIAYVYATRNDEMVVIG